MVLNTAVMVDGEFFLRRHRECYPQPADSAKEHASRCALDLFDMATAHARDDGGSDHSLYRIFFYDCEPLSKKVHRPISGKALDYGETPVFAFRTELHKALVRTRKVALRLGKLQDGVAGWKLRESALKALLKKTRQFAAAAIADATGLDAASVKNALKALVDNGQVRVSGKARGTSYVWVG
jgi:hypothetical protein